MVTNYDDTVDKYDDTIEDPEKNSDVRNGITEVKFDGIAEHLESNEDAPAKGSSRNGATEVSRRTPNP